MSEWKLGIPKIAHFFWDNRPMSFLRWLSLQSFSVFNPDWQLKLHMTPDSVSPNWRQANNKDQQSEDSDQRGHLGEIARLEIINEPSFHDLHGVQQSDILRNKYLFEDGGLWSDIDILYFNSMSKILCNIQQYADHDMGLCVPRGWFPIAFMMAKSGAPFFQAVYEHQMEILAKHGGHGEYQKFGTRVYGYSLDRGGFPFFPIAREEVYQCDWRGHASIFAGMVNMDLGVGIHWYGGSHSAVIAEKQILRTNWQEHRLAPVIERSMCSPT